MISYAELVYRGSLSADQLQVGTRVLIFLNDHPAPSGFPPGAVAWDFNYRGPLTFLSQARHAGVATEDGWDYFVADWSAALAAITGTDLTPELLSRAARSARAARPGRHSSDPR